MSDSLTFVLALAVVYGLPCWIAYRCGYRKGLGIWRKAYGSMTKADIREHMRIIRAMDQGKLP